VLAEVHPIHHERHQVQCGQISGEQLSQRGLGLRDTADLEVLVAAFSVRAPTGSSATG